MARLNRMCLVGIPQHIVQRGNNRQVCFNGDEDMTAYTVFRSAICAVI
jgi:putative transposase